MKLSDVDLKVIAGIRNAVAARGADWLYPTDKTDPNWWSKESCVNLQLNGDPACIIGFIAVDQGLPTKEVSSAIYDAVNWGVSSAVAQAMIAAQGTQDRGHTWGAAAARFFQVLEEEGVKVPK